MMLFEILFILMSEFEKTEGFKGFDDEDCQKSFLRFIEENGIKIIEERTDNGSE